MRKQKKIIDVLVIGDGIAGCLAALAARNRRADVIIVEKSQPDIQPDIHRRKKPCCRGEYQAPT